MGMLMAWGCAERGRAVGRTVTTVPTISYSVGGQRSWGSSSWVRETEKKTWLISWHTSAKDHFKCKQM